MDIKELHAQGLSNREIGRKLSLHHKVVAQQLKQLGLVSNEYKDLIVVESDTAICNKCGVEKSIKEYQFNRRGTPNQYRFGYCNDCRKEQVYLNLNNSKDAFIGDRVNRAKIRANKLKLDFNITPEYIKHLLELQEYKCVYTQEILLMRVGSGYSEYSLSFDKVNPSKGYTIGNVVLCTVRANTIKHNQTLEELAQWMPLWFDRLLYLLDKINKEGDF